MANYTQGVPTIADPALWTPVLVRAKLRMGIFAGSAKNIVLSVYRWSGSVWVRQ